MRATQVVTQQRIKLEYLKIDLAVYAMFLCDHSARSCFWFHVYSGIMISSFFFIMLSSVDQHGGAFNSARCSFVEAVQSHYSLDGLNSKNSCGLARTP
jgi:hypothetical protein